MQRLSRCRSGNGAGAGLSLRTSLPPWAGPGRAGTAPLQGRPWAGSAPGLETSGEGAAGAGSWSDRSPSPAGAWEPGEQTTVSARGAWLAEAGSVGQRARDGAVGQGGRGLGGAVGPRRPARTPGRLTDRAPLPLVSPAPPAAASRLRGPRAPAPGTPGAQFGRGPGEPCLPARAARAATSRPPTCWARPAGGERQGPFLARLSGRVELPGARLSPAVMIGMCLSPESYNLSQVFYCSCNVLSCRLCPLPCFSPLFPSCSSLGREKASRLSSAQLSLGYRRGNLALGLLQFAV